MRILNVLLFAAFLMTFAPTAEAKLITYGGEKVCKVVDLPDNEICFDEGQKKYVDVGCVYKQVTILFIPVWNYDIRWCGYIGKNDTYIIADDTILRSLATINNIEYSNTPTLPFWDAWGGKILVLLIVGGFLAYEMIKKTMRRNA